MEVGKRVIVLLWVVFFCFGFVFHHCCLVWVFFLFFVCKFLLCMHFEDSLQFFIYFVEHKFCRERTKVGCFFVFVPLLSCFGFSFCITPKSMTPPSSLFSYLCLLLLFCFARFYAERMIGELGLF